MQTHPPEFINRFAPGSLSLLLSVAHFWSLFSLASVVVPVQFFITAQCKALSNALPALQRFASTFLLIFPRWLLQEMTPTWKFPLLQMSHSITTFNYFGIWLNDTATGIIRDKSTNSSAHLMHTFSPPTHFNKRTHLWNAVIVRFMGAKWHHLNSSQRVSLIRGTHFSYELAFIILPR